ncbi:hypothetical protein E2C01_040539 [Portunus trituberculatus]|uniref:Transmembrane protein n=1 Tax=Portunus trituberculatus TaxID=210409 RepID=A0A5B7FHQ8_PORTR|nr:hypothetical protein [Portunus trituberculatus]
MRVRVSVDRNVLQKTHGSFWARPCVVKRIQGVITRLSNASISTSSDIVSVAHVVANQENLKIVVVPIFFGTSYVIVLGFIR